jgi:hypothetical protein
MADRMTPVFQNTPTPRNAFDPSVLGLLPPIIRQTCYDEIQIAYRTAIALFATGMRQYSPKTKSVVHEIKVVAPQASALLERYHNYLFSGRRGWDLQECWRRYRLLESCMGDLSRLQQLMKDPQHLPVAKYHVPYLEAFCKLSERRLFMNIGPSLAGTNSDLDPFVITLEDWEMKKLNVNKEWLKEVILRLQQEAAGWHSLMTETRPVNEEIWEELRETVSAHLACKAVANVMCSTMDDVLKVFHDYARGVGAISDIRWCLDNADHRQVVRSIWKATRRSGNIVSASTRLSVLHTLCQLKERWFDGPFQSADPPAFDRYNFRPKKQFWIDKEGKCAQLSEDDIEGAAAVVERQ